jgi:hypothetical protein
MRMHLTLKETQAFICKADQSSEYYGLSLKLEDIKAWNIVDYFLNLEDIKARSIME